MEVVRSAVLIYGNMAAQMDRGVPVSTLCPKYLHSNSTSHTWPFSAIAELIDNACDPDVLAKHFWIDKTVVQGQECLSFMDNGKGLDYETMHKMLSFGYSDKTAINGHQPIGVYGNGFKSGSMRLGRDAIVFSKSESTSCVGMLSQTYLEKIRAKQIIVPIVCFEQTETNKFSVKEEHKASLRDILRYSPFKTEEELLIEINAITSSFSTSKTGTRIIIWNLRRTSTGTAEFDFEKDRYDIRIPADLYEEINDKSPYPGVKTYIPESEYSLRAYCSILYLKPRMQIIIRSQKVNTQIITKTLALVRKDYYKPVFLPRRVCITFGYNTKSKDQYGVMMYHKNRLIKAYERVGCQLKASYKGVGVIGVIECNFLDPTHNKQSFNETDKYRKTMNSLATKLEEYWEEIRHRRKTEDPNSLPVEDTVKRPDQNWVQCDECMKWRKLPDGIDCNKLPSQWYCRLNPDPQFRNCQVEEEPVDSDDETRPSYRKTYKQKEREDKKRQKEEEERKRQEAQRMADLARRTPTPKQHHERQHEKLRRQLHQKQPDLSPSTPRTLKSRFNIQPVRVGAARAVSSTISPAACSPSSSSGLPVITDVCSLSPAPLRGKRTQPPSLQSTPKRPKVNGLLSGTSDLSTSVDVSPRCSPPVPAIVDDDSDDTDDDIFILETASTPKPQKPGFDLTKVKTEKEQSDAGMEYSNDAAPDVASETNAAGTGTAVSASEGTSPSPAPPLALVSATTQTEVPKVKEEEETQNQTEWEERAGPSSKGQSSGVDVEVSTEQRGIKQESGRESQSKTQGEQSAQKGSTNHQTDEDVAGPSCANACHNGDSPPLYPSMAEVQEQQDQLLELMQATAQERDSLKEQVNKLTCQLQDMQNRLEELSQLNVKKEFCHQASQTEETDGGKDYKSLFEKAKQKVDKLIEDKEALLAAAENKPSAVQAEEEDNDEFALQVDRLLRDLDQRNKETDELRSKLDSVEEERANLASQCEELRLNLQQQRENAQEGRTTGPQEAAGAAGGAADSNSNTFQSLIELRHSIGRLLVSFVPALELDQVNYECNVIDEILEQVLTTVESVGPVGLEGRAINTT